MMLGTVVLGYTTNLYFRENSPTHSILDGIALGLFAIGLLVFVFGPMAWHWRLKKQ